MGRIPVPRFNGCSLHEQCLCESKTMLIYGSQMYFKKNVVKSNGECEYCGAYGKLKSYQARKFGHLYFIPVLPQGPRSQVLRECKRCSMGTHIPLNDLEPMADALSDQFKSWIVAIQDGQTEVVPNGGTEPVNVGVLIAGILEELYCLKEIESVESISSILAASNMGYENEIVQGRWHEIQGDLEKAKMSFQAAHRSRPREPMPLFQMGSLAAKSGNVQEAESAFQSYSKLMPEDISPYIELSGVYEKTKNFAGIVRAYDMIYTLNPDVIPDAGMKKIYKKACKKSGSQGKFLDQM
jgi:tetratricopeptide (TPR) repeat protein